MAPGRRETPKPWTPGTPRRAPEFEVTSEADDTRQARKSRFSRRSFRFLLPRRCWGNSIDVGKFIYIHLFFWRSQALGSEINRPDRRRPSSSC